MFVKSSSSVNLQLESDSESKKKATSTFEIAPYFQRIETNIVDRLIIKITSIVLSLSEYSSKIDDKIVDGLVLKISFGLKNLGDKIRKSQSGQIQLYLLGLVIIILCIVFIKIIIF